MTEASTPKVAIACPGVGLVQRGFERLFEDLHHVVADDLDITLFKGGGSNCANEKVLRFASRNGVLTRVVPIHALVGRTRIHSECLTFAMALLPHLRRGGFDVVHCIDPPLARLLHAMRRRFGLDFRLLYTEGCAMPPADYPPADHVHQISPESFREAVTWGIPAERMTLIAPGIHPRRFETTATRDELRRKHAVNPGTFVVLCVAAINRMQKRIDCLIEEAARLDGDVLLWLDGSMDQGDRELPALARRRLGDRCRISRVESGRVGELYHLADVMVLASVHEAFGLVIAEASASGLPVITHDAAHFRWLVPDPAAHVDMRVSGALSGRLARLRDHPDELARLMHAEEMRRRFDWENLKPKYLDLYRRVAELQGPIEPDGSRPARRRLSRLRSAGVRTLRAAGLLKGADAVRYWAARARSGPRNRRFRRVHPDFPTPPPSLAYDAFNHVDWNAYREGGLRHARVFAGIILEETGEESLDILEWGCGPGRLIRHLRHLLPGRTVTLTGTDYNPRTIRWCRENLEGIEFDTNELFPPLALDAGRFDVVYNFSVFTHLSEKAQTAWAAELRRVMKPGGLLICTTHGDAYRYLLASRRERRRYNSGQAVTQGRYTEGRKWFFAVHPPRFVREVLLKGFRDVKQVPTTPADEMLQDVWAARK